MRADLNGPSSLACAGTRSFVSPPDLHQHLRSAGYWFWSGFLSFLAPDHSFVPHKPPPSCGWTLTTTRPGNSLTPGFPGFLSKEVQRTK
jgi:hypothetical protein